MLAVKATTLISARTHGVGQGATAGSADACEESGQQDPFLGRHLAPTGQGASAADGSQEASNSRWDVSRKGHRWRTPVRGVTEL
jgi:hypothetical protein